MFKYPKMQVKQHRIVANGLIFFFIPLYKFSSEIYAHAINETRK